MSLCVFCMQELYQPSAIEQTAQQEWEQANAFFADDAYGSNIQRREL